MNSISELVVAHQKEIESKREKKQEADDEANKPPIITSSIQTQESQKDSDSNTGTLIMDATVSPQNITYPTDLKLLNAARKKSEALIDKLYNKSIHVEIKVRTYRQLARKDFLNGIKKKTKSFKEIYKCNGSQLRYLKRNLAHLQLLLDGYEKRHYNIS